MEKQIVPVSMLICTLIVEPLKDQNGEQEPIYAEVWQGKSSGRFANNPTV